MDPNYFSPYESNEFDSVNMQTMLPMQMPLPMPDMTPMPILPQFYCPNNMGLPTMMEPMNGMPDMMPSMNGMYNMMTPSQMITPSMMPQMNMLPPDMNYEEMYEESLLSDNPPTMFSYDTENSYRPQPVLSNNPPVSRIVLFKELTGYPNYGNPSGNADILYTGNRGVWTFNIPGIFAFGDAFSGRLVISAVLDDSDAQINLYSANITINGRTVHTGRLPLVHGRPFGQRFDTWRPLTFNVPDLRRNNRIVITNTSNAGPNNWIGLDWMELRINR